MAQLLVADDDAVTRDMVARALTAAGHGVVTVADGQEALDTIGAAPGSFALLITDVHMPIIDGVELAGRVRAAAPHVKVLLMSGLAEGQVRAKAIDDATSVGYLAKPFTMDALKSAVRSLIG